MGIKRKIKGGPLRAAFFKVKNEETLITYNLVDFHYAFVLYCECYLYDS